MKKRLMSAMKLLIETVLPAFLVSCLIVFAFKATDSDHATMYILHATIFMFMWEQRSKNASLDRFNYYSNEIDKSQSAWNAQQEKWNEVTTKICDTHGKGVVATLDAMSGNMKLVIDRLNKLESRMERGYE